MSATHVVVRPGTAGLGPEQVAEYHEKGFLVLRGVFAAEEVALLAAEADDLAARIELIDVRNIRCRWSDHVETKVCTFDCFDPVSDIGPVCRFFAHDRRLLDVLRSLYDDEPHLFKDKLIFKPPGSKGYALHQDFIGWADFPESFLTAIVAIDPTGAANGATEVFPGVHSRGYLSPRDGQYHELPLSEVDESTGVLLELAPGDVAIFGGFVPHRSAPNRSDQPRRQLYLSYNAGRDGGDRRADHYREFHAWLKTKYAEYGKTETFFR